MFVANDFACDCIDILFSVAITLIVASPTTLSREQKLILQAENPHFAPLVYVGEELQQIRILGKAVSFQSAVR